MRQNTGGSANIGGSSILVIFVLLCITTFATLAMVSATASFRLAEQVAQAANDYFAAESIAEEKLAKISNIIRTYSYEDFSLRLTEIGAFYNEGFIYFGVYVNESMRIDVELRVMGASIMVYSWVQVPIFDPAEYGGGQITLWPGF